MMIDLNGKDFAQNTVSIFNNGNAGVAKNVDVTLEKRAPGEPETYPDYKVIYTDEHGSVNQGFYYFTPNPSDSPDRQKTRETQEVSRVLHIARAVMGDTYAFPAVNSAREAYDVLFGLIEKNLAGKKFNVFVTYGTLTKPNKKGYLGVRYFNFIEPATVEKSRLKVGTQDLMERIEADSPTMSSGTSATTVSWT